MQEISTAGIDNMAQGKDISKFVNDQLSRWPLACENFRALKNVHVRELSVGGLTVRVQHNPARIISSAARTDAASLNARPCFLCRDNRPKEQMHIGFDGRKGKKYDILVNPYPIFPDHLVIAFAGHSPQSIWKRYVDILDLARAYPDHIFFYNGPKCGASAPDHHHFQGTGRGQMPLENDVDRLLDDISGRMPDSAGTDEGVAAELEYLSSVQDADLFHYRKFTRGIFVLRSGTAKSAAKLFYRLIDCAPVPDGDNEPRFNLFTWFRNGEFRSIIIFRTCHRSGHYFSDGPGHLTMSPGCVDMAGLFIAPVKEDFLKLDERLLEEMLSEVSVQPDEEEMIVRRLVRTQPKLSVGIMSGKEIEFEIFSDGAGPRKAVYREGKIEYCGALYDGLDFGEVTPSTMFAGPTFALYGVTIGKGFHWERKETQKFAGTLKIIVVGESLVAVDVVGVEDYLVSVISSEMKSTASLEFLKTHAVISRSWVMAQIARRRTAGQESAQSGVCTAQTVAAGTAVSPSGQKCPNRPGKDFVETSPESAGGEDREIIRWYDRTDHRDFDVCADDHCQRYQGLTRAVGKTVRDAVDLTWGEVLTYEGRICDARFSKCCGGVTEKFSTCWDDTDYPYLPALPDTPGHGICGSYTAGGMSEESSLMHDGSIARETVDCRAFCDTDDMDVLSQVLNDYDLRTKDFYRWEIKYGRDELSGIVRERTGTDIGRIISLEPLERGGSGRIRKLRLTGDKGTLTVGKELEIRKVLSDTHLKSSAFYVEYLDAAGNPVQPTCKQGPKAAGSACKPASFISMGGYEGDGTVGGPAEWTEVVLHGRGWGHGVGLCQIGAAVMASRGYTYRQILEHYYPGTAICPAGLVHPSADSPAGHCVSPGHAVSRDGQHGFQTETDK